MRKGVFCCRQNQKPFFFPFILILNIFYSFIYGVDEGKIRVSVQIHTQQITGHNLSIEEI